MGAHGVTYTVAELVARYLALYEKLGRQPGVRDDRELRFHAEAKCPELGSWNALVKAAGFEPMWDHTKPSLDDLVNAYRALKLKLGRQPQTRDNPKLAMKAKRYAGSWNALVRAAGDIPLFNAVEHLSTDDLVTMYRETRAKLGRQLRRVDATTLDYYARKHPEIGSWNKLVELAGDTPHNPRKASIHRR